MFRNRINDKIFEEILERSEESLEILEKNNPDSLILKELKEDGSLPVDYQQILDYIIQTANQENGQLL